MLTRPKAHEVTFFLKKKNYATNPADVLRKLLAIVLVTQRPNDPGHSGLGL
jgi:hypothetical protein